MPLTLVEKRRLRDQRLAGCTPLLSQIEKELEAKGIKISKVPERGYFARIVEELAKLSGISITT